MQLGVSGFVVSTCATYADFGARIPFYAPWIAEQLAEYDVMCGHAVADAFASWPLPTSERTMSDSNTRCFADGVKWACESSGECIDWVRRCDGLVDCEDGTDEILDCPEDFWGANCSTVVDMFNSSLEFSKQLWWELYDTYVNVSGVGLFPPSDATNHIVGVACSSWLSQFSNSSNGTAAGASNLSASAPVFKALLKPCLHRNGSAVLHDPESGRYVLKIAYAHDWMEYCLNQIVHTEIFLKAREDIVETFRQEHQQCSEFASFDVVTSTAIPASMLETGVATSAGSSPFPTTVTPLWSFFILLWLT